MCVCAYIYSYMYIHTLDVYAVLDTLRVEEALEQLTVAVTPASHSKFAHARF